MSASPAPSLPTQGDVVVRRIFVTIAFAEAVSWLGLLIGMYVKYVPETTEAGVKIFGPIHGAIFLLYVGSTIAAAVWFRWSWRVALVGLVCSIPPFATVVFERVVARRGLLDTRHRDAFASTDETPDAARPRPR